MQAPYIPPQDGPCATWADNFSTLLTASPTTYGLVAGDATAVAGVVSPWVIAYAAAINPSTRGPMTIAAKDAARAAMELVVRPYAQQISRNPAVANDDKVAIGVNLPNTARTPVPPPTTQPTLALVSAQHNLHVVSYRDQSTPTSKAKPVGVTGLQLFVHDGTVAVTDPAMASFLAVPTKSPQSIDTTGYAAGHILTYFGRWITRSGPGGSAQFGPWSAPLSVAVV